MNFKKLEPLVPWDPRDFNIQIWKIWINWKSRLHQVNHNLYLTNYGQKKVQK
jgi:hypothetical protein